jgi:acyl-CoA thioester hydrolase/thioesterase-3
MSQRKRFATEFNARFSDFDMQGILNSSKYVDFLSEARIDQMRTGYKLPFDHYTKKNLTWFFSSVNLEFLKPIFFGNTFRVETEVVKIEGPMGWVEFCFTDLEGRKTHAKGTATYHLVDLATKRPVDVPTEDADIFLSRP